MPSGSQKHCPKITQLLQPSILYINHKFIFFLLANMRLLYYSHTIYIQRSMFPTGIPGNRAVLTSLKNFKNRSGLNGKPEPMSLTKVAIQTTYCHFYCPLIASKTYRNINIHTKHKHKLRKLHQTIISFVGTERSRLIHLLLEVVFLIQIHRCILRRCRGQSAQISPQRWFSQLLQVVQLHHATHNLLPLEFCKLLDHSAQDQAFPEEASEQDSSHPQWASTLPTTLLKSKRRIRLMLQAKQRLSLCKRVFQIEPPFPQILPSISWRLGLRRLLPQATNTMSASASAAIASLLASFPR